MLYLIKLEFKKYRLKRHIKGAIIAILGIIAFITSIFIGNILNPKQQLDTYNRVLWIINVLVTGTFLIYSSIVIAKIIIGEYKNKTISVMFLYPISRRKIVLAKLLIIVLFTMSSIFIGYILCTLYVVFFDSFINVVEGSFSLNYTFFSILLGSIFMGGILSLVPFTIGMIKKSVPSTIISAILMAFLIQPIVGREPDLKNTFIKLGYISLFSIGIATYTLMKKINNIDNMDVI